MEIAYHEVLQTVQAHPCPRVRIPPPNRLDITNWDLAAGLACSFFGEDPLESLRDALRRLTGRQQIFFAPSCRAAIAEILSLLPVREVVMPAFTCPVVKTAVRFAGKQIEYVDIAPHSVNATSQEFAEKALAGRVLLPTHLFGIPADIERICALAKERDCLTIEDAAAAFGAKHNGRVLGTFGDFGIFSFERSKRLPAFSGAAIIVNNESLIDPAKLASHRVVRTECEAPVREAFKAAMYNLATVPSFYGRAILPRLLRAYRDGKALERCQSAADGLRTRFYTREFHPYQAALVLRALRRLNQIHTHIEKLVGIYHNALRSAAVETFLPPGSDLGALLRFPIAFPEQERSDVLLAALRSGLYLETNFEQPLVEPDQYHRYPRALWAARNLVLLPLYRRLGLDVAQQLAEKITKIAVPMSVSSKHRVPEEHKSPKAEFALPAVASQATRATAAEFHPAPPGRGSTL